MQVNNLPVEIQNKIFYFLEHPTAKLIKEVYNKNNYNINNYNRIKCEAYWNDLIYRIKRMKFFHERLREDCERDRMGEEDINYKYLIHPISRGFKLAHRYTIRSMDYKWRNKLNFYEVWQRLDKVDKRVGY